MNISHISHIMELYDEFHIVLIPVLWGEKGDNGLYIKLPEDKITFINTNLEKPITDFKFWMLHELAHAMTIELEEEDAELFADHLAQRYYFLKLKPREFTIFSKALALLVLRLIKSKE